MKPDIKDNSRQGNSYLKYTGLAFQMAAVIALGLVAGQWLDGIFNLSVPVCTISLILIFFGTFMYKLYSEISGKK
jgi:hypothetical protein